jgi:hypothetical protein
MATMMYIAKFRNLKRIYCEAYGTNISDVTWYRISSQIRKYLFADFNSISAEGIVKTVGGLKKLHRNFNISSDVFGEAMGLFSHYKKMDKTMTCAEFLFDLAEKIDVTKVSRTTRYVWFESSGIPFKFDTAYHTDQFALVAFRAAKSIHNKHGHTAIKCAEIMNSRKPSSDSLNNDSLV